MNVRSATEADLSYLVESIEALSRHTRRDATAELVLALPESAGPHEVQLAKRHLESGSAVALVAQRGEQRVGCLLADVRESDVGWSRHPVGHVSVCWVDPAFRRRGVARRLLATAERDLFGRGVEIIELSYVTTNREAEATWKGLGYAPCRVLATKEKGPSDP